MPESTSIISILLKSIFIGFGFAIPIISLLKTSKLKTIEFKELFILTAVQTLRISGILYFVMFCIHALVDYYRVHSGNQAVVVQSPFFGPYWIIKWVEPAMYLLLSQLFWIKKLYLKKASLITFSILLLLLPSKRLLLMLQTYSRNHLSPGSVLPAGTILLELLLNCIVFIFIIITIMLATGKLKNKTV